MNKNAMKIPSIHIFKSIIQSHFSDGDQEPNKEPGDVIIQLEEKSHDFLQRHGNGI